jgi:hypothetical protein
MTTPPPFDPWRDRRAAVTTLLAAREAGATLRRAAAAAGVHVATVCRWALRSPDLAAALQAASHAARLAARQAAARPEPGAKPLFVPWHPACPCCGGSPVVLFHTASGRLYYWGHRCGWRSWRPRHPEDCPDCGGARFWAHSRRSVSCPSCQRRWPVDQRIRPNC